MSDRIEYCARCHEDYTVGEDESPMCSKCEAMTAAERAIVEAADAWRGDHRPAAEDALVRAVDAWRKLKGKG